MKAILTVALIYAQFFGFIALFANEEGAGKVVATAEKDNVNVKAQIQKGSALEDVELILQITNLRSDAITILTIGKASVSRIEMTSRIEKGVKAPKTDLGKVFENSLFATSSDYVVVKSQEEVTRHIRLADLFHLRPGKWSLDFEVNAIPRGGDRLNARSIRLNVKGLKLDLP